MSEFLHYVLYELRRSLGLVLLLGIAVAVGLTLIRVLYRRKFGPERKFPWSRIALLLAFFGYLVIVFCVTCLRSSHMAREVNLHLFRAWREALNNFSQHRWMNVLLNIAMFVPLGFLLPLLNCGFRKWYVTIPAGFGTSLTIELIQLAFASGVFDVDDLFCNTLGAAFGFFGIMMLLGVGCERGARLKTILIYGVLAMACIGSVASVFVVYHNQEFGNLPQAPAYTVDTSGAVWTLACELPDVMDHAAIYQIRTRSTEDCDAFAEDFKKRIPTDFDDISYYQEAAYYMNHGSENGAHFLYVNYLDQGYEYRAIYEDEPVWKDLDREFIVKALEKYPLQIPDSAEFTAEGEGWHSFSVKQQIENGSLLDGTLRVRIAGDGTVRQIENGLLSYTYFKDVQILTPEEAYRRLLSGEFNDEGFFERKQPKTVVIMSCTLEYRVDTKGFYQPVYVFEVGSEDGSYRDRIVIPALK